jgi:hypothetical protein
MVKLEVNDYSDTIFAIDALTAERQELYDSLITPEIKAKMVEIDAKYSPRLEHLEYKKKALEDDLKASALFHEATIKGVYHAFTFVKGRTTWDNKSLEGYAAAHPEILAFRKIGEPSVSIKKV